MKEFLLLLIIVFSSFSLSIQNDVSTGTLPTTISPKIYNLALSLSNNLTSRRFTGTLLLTFITHEEVSEIWLNSRGHQVSQIEAVIFNERDELTANATAITRESNDVIKISLTSTLHANATYQMILTFGGNLMLTSEGFYRTAYSIIENGIERFIWQAATNFSPHSARHAFPCYDDPKYRANFQISIQHNSSFISLASANDMGREESSTGAVRTNFHYVNAIAPHSLAVFVMSSIDFVQQTTSFANTKHIVSLRRTEADFSRKFIESLESVVNHVENFLDSTLPNEFLHHVVLPDHSNDVSGYFYNFNYYREHLILFNPVISPQTKEFSIRRMIATGLLSQFLGNVLTFASHNEAWIFNGLIKFLQYFITSNSSDDASQKIFINEILHPTLHYRHQQLFAFHSMEDERAACIFHMIYRSIGAEVFSMALQSLIAENAYSSITSEIFFNTLQIAHEKSVDEQYRGDMSKVIKDFMNATNEDITVTAFLSYNGSLLYILKPDIMLPLEYISSKMEEPSILTWSEGTFEIIALNLQLSESENDWFLLNPKRRGFYRVNYVNTNWQSLIRAIKTQGEIFNHETIAQLTDDALSFARDGLLSYRIVFDMLENLKQEASLIVWNTASLNLLELNNRLYDLDFYHHFRDFVHEMSVHYMETIGFDDLDDEPLMNKFSRLQMIDFACQMNFDECLSKMNAQLVSYLDEDGVKLPVNLESSIFCYGLRASASKNESRYFLEVWLEMQDSQDTEYRLKIIHALGCYNDANVLYDYMETITAPVNSARYRIDEYLPVIQSAYSRTHEGIEAVIRFLTRYSGTAITRTRTPNLVEIVISDIAPRIFDYKLFEQLTTMMVTLNVSQNIFDAAKLRVEQNIAWKLNPSANEIRDWLENRVNPTTTCEWTKATTTTSQDTSSSTTSTSSTPTTSASTTTTEGNANKVKMNNIFFMIFPVIIIFHIFQMSH